MLKKISNVLTRHGNKYLRLAFWSFLFFVVFIFLSTQIFKVISNSSHGAWGIFHYYIGAKYIKEVGYFDLYNCAIKVSSPNLKTIKSVRNLNTYEIVPIDELRKCPIKNFSKERWTEFTKDIITITNNAPSYYWEVVLTDKGFNAPPFWTFLATPLANIMSIDNPFVYLIIFNLDLILIFASTLFISQAFGKKLGFLTFVLSLFYFGTFETLTNNYLQYIWFPFLTCAFICWQKNKHHASGLSLGVASGLQAFPIIFALPILLMLLTLLLFRQKKINEISTQFIFSFLLSLAFCAALGGLSSGRISIWNDWYEKITIHSAYTKGEIFNIGLTNLAGTLLYSKSTNTNTYIDSFTTTVKRNEVINKNKLLIDFLKVIIILPPILLLFYSRRNQPLSYGYFFLYIFLNLSPYYYLTLVLMPVAFRNSSSIIRRFVCLGVTVLFLIHILLFWGTGYITFGYYLHLISELSIFLFFVLLIIFLLLENKKYFLRGIFVKAKINHQLKTLF